MKICKDCLHYSKCKKIGIYNIETLSICEDFADHADWLHLPIKIGDYLYTNISHQGWYFRKRNAPYKVKVVFVGLYDSENMGGGYFNVVFQNEGMYAFYFSDIGKTIFLTEEEAK